LGRSFSTATETLALDSWPVRCVRETLTCTSGGLTTASGIHVGIIVAPLQALLMTYLPRWLAMEGFTMLIREASADYASTNIANVPNLFIGSYDALRGIEGLSALHPSDVTEQEFLTQELRRREAYLAQAEALSHTGCRLRMWVMEWKERVLVITIA
jgi:hypothetical protein